MGAMEELKHSISKVSVALERLFRLKKTKSEEAKKPRFMKIR